jgi:TRAP-type C4-dicarboxylate transport system substrate-binding protein
VLTAPNTLRGIRDHVVDAGYMIVQFHINDLPYASLLGELTGLGTDTYATLGALNEVYFQTCEGCRADFKKHGLVPLFVQSATPLTMNCTKPVKSIDDLDGLRLSAIGTSEMRWGATLGMTPRRQNFSDMVQALQLGQADCFLGPIAWIKSYGLTDTIKTVIEMPQGVVTGAVPFTFNNAAWAKVGDADKKTMARMMARWLYEYVEDAYVDSDVSVKKELEGKVAFVTDDKSFEQKWSQYQQKEIPALIQLAESRKLEGGKELVEAMATVFKKWHTEHLPKFKGKPDVYTEILAREVFEKVDY